MPRVVILLGPPGAGKGTQAARLSRELSLPHISTGDLFRENRAQGTPLGKKAQEFMDAGRLVPDELVLDMLFDRVSRPDCSKGYLLDGFPRTLPQAEALEKRLGKGASVQAINLAVADAALVERMTGRRTCEKCGNIHHVKYAPPKVAGVCDKCSGKLVQRSDDTAQTVQKRLSVYHDQTAPLERFYSERGVLDSVDGSRSPDAVFQSLKQTAAGAGAR